MVVVLLVNVDTVERERVGVAATSTVSAVRLLNFVCPYPSLAATFPRLLLALFPCLLLCPPLLPPVTPLVSFAGRDSCWALFVVVDNTASTCAAAVADDGDNDTSFIVAVATADDDDTREGEQAALLLLLPNTFRGGVSLIVNPDANGDDGVDLEVATLRATAVGIVVKHFVGEL